MLADDQRGFQLVERCSGYAARDSPAGMSSDDMAAEFNSLAAESPGLANLIRQDSVAALVNVQSVQGIAAAIVRRASAGN